MEARFNNMVIVASAFQLLNIRVVLIARIATDW